jgi:hypothetical protein
MPYIGDDYLTVKEFKALRQKYREAKTTTPWKAWATWYLSPTGKRDRDVTERARQAEAKNQTAIAAGMRAQRQAMDQEWNPIAAQEATIRRAGVRDVDMDTGVW